MNRRNFLSITAASAALALRMVSPYKNGVLAAETSEIKAIAFDGFPIFDPRPIFALVKTLFPDDGDSLGKLWFSKIFAYTWLRTAGHNYRLFYAVVEDALIFSADSLGLALTQDKQEQLMDIWFNLSVWPDVKPALQQLREQGIRLGFLSNLGEDMLRINAKNSDIEDMFELYLSTDRVEAFKPSRSAYQMGVDAFMLPKENIAFAAFGAWDAAGADWYGYPTVWVNRLNVRLEELGPNSIKVGRDISTLVDFVASKAVSGRG